MFVYKIWLALLLRLLAYRLSLKEIPVVVKEE